MKVLIVGIDGATWRVLDRAMARGVMPFLGELVSTGSREVLKSTRPPLTPAAWSSFHMSRNPGYHGVVDFVSWNRSNREVGLVDSHWLGETVWQRLEKAGLRTTLINVPMTYPGSPIASQVVTGILTPDVTSEWSYPLKLKQQILQHVPNYEPVSLGHQSAKQIEQNTDEFLAIVAQALKQRTQLAEWFIARQSQDILMVQYQVIDWVQHALWYGLDPEHTDYDAKLETKIFEQIYGLLDTYIVQLVNHCQSINGYKPTVLLVSDHGFQKHKQRILLGNYLYQKGVLDRRAGLKKKLNTYLYQTPVELKNLSPFELLGRSQWGYAYLYEGFEQAHIFQKLQEVCKALIDPVSKQPVIKHIWQRHELYNGPKIDLLPNILFEPIDGYSISTAIDKAKGWFEPVIRGQDFHLGIHHQDGIIATDQPKVTLPSSIERFGDWLEDQLK